MCKWYHNYHNAGLTSLNLTRDLWNKPFNKCTQKLSFWPISSLVWQSFKPTLIFQHYRSLTNFCELAINILIFGWAKVNKKPSFELLPRRNSVASFIPIVSLDCISIKLDCGHFYLGFFWGSMKMKNFFCPIDLTSRSPIFPSCKFYLNAWVVYVTILAPFSCIS